VEGHVVSTESGSGGFGYDPLFVPEDYEQTFGELAASVKNQLSHRARALQKLVPYLREQYPASEAT
jgi:XTP/dITP diphosphohydrolase